MFPMRQAEGIPARSLAEPVLLAINHSSSCLRDTEDKVSPINSFTIMDRIALGLVVSRTSPGILEFRKGSIREIYMERLGYSEGDLEEFEREGVI